MALTTTTALLILAASYITVSSAQEIPTSCVEDKDLETSLSDAKGVSVLFYVENRCPCLAHRVRYELNAGVWIRAPPEEIHPLECLLISSQSFAGNDETTTGRVVYSCSMTDTKNAMEIKWDSPVANVTYFEDGVSQPFLLVADDITATTAFTSCGMKP